MVQSGTQSVRATICSATSARQRLVLELVNSTTAIGERHLGHLCKLVGWHKQDHVDDAERRRNDVIFRVAEQRNPFVDHPKLGAEHLDRCLLVGGRP